MLQLALRERFRSIEEDHPHTLDFSHSEASDDAWVVSHLITDYDYVLSS